MALKSQAKTLKSRQRPSKATWFLRVIWQISAFGTFLFLFGVYVVYRGAGSRLPNLQTQIASNNSVTVGTSPSQT